MLRPVRRGVVVLLLMLATGVYASLGAQKPAGNRPAATKDQLAAEVSAELEGKVFLTKIELGSMNRMTYQDGSIGHKPIDTEIQPDSSVEMKATFWSYEASHHGTAPVLTSNSEDHAAGRGLKDLAGRWFTVVKGTWVRVTSIEAKSDRLELLLAAAPNGAYARLKLMLGKDYERKYDAESVLTLAGTALRIPRVETRLRLESRFAELQQLMASVRAGMAMSATADVRLKQVVELKALLQEAIQNRWETESATGHVTLVAEGFRTELRDIESRIGALQTAVADERATKTLASRFAELERQTASARAGMNASTPADERLKHALELKARLQDAIRNRGEMESVTKQAAPEAVPLKRELADTESAIGALQKAATAERVANARAELARVVAQGEELRGLSATPDKTMAEWEARRDAATRWIANAQKRQTVLRTLADLGSAEPEQEAATAEDQRAAQARVASLDDDKTQARLRDLETTYRAMVQKRAQLLDVYTRAYGTAGQFAAAQELIAHLQRMYENRTAAAVLGDTGAKAEAATVQREMEKLRR